MTLTTLCVGPVTTYTLAFAYLYPPWASAMMTYGANETSRRRERYGANETSRRRERYEWYTRCVTTTYSFKEITDYTTEPTVSLSVYTLPRLKSDTEGFHGNSNPSTHILSDEGGIPPSTDTSFIRKKGFGV